jgi:hypothetical protein
MQVSDIKNIKKLLVFQDYMYIPENRVVWEGKRILEWIELLA